MIQNTIKIKLNEYIQYRYSKHIQDGLKSIWMELNLGLIKKNIISNAFSGLKLGLINLNALLVKQNIC